MLDNMPRLANPAPSTSLDGRTVAPARGMRGNIRWTICFSLLALVTHALLTRAGMSVAAQGIQREFGLSNVEIGWILSGFIVGYALPQFPAGLLVDRAGAHRLLAASVMGWSFFTLVTGFAPWYAFAGIGAALYVVRFLTGIGQASVLACAIRINASWMPLTERASANGLAMMGIGLGGMLAPPLVVALMARFGWQMPFYVFGAAGLLLGWFWLRYGGETPEEHPRVTAVERELIRAGREPRGSAHRRPLGPILRSPRVWCLAVAYGVAGYTSYVFFTWFFLYVVNVRKVDLRASGYWTMLPPLAMTVGTLVGGRVCDWLTARFGRFVGRTSVALAGELTAAALIVAGARIENTYVAVSLLALGAGFHLMGQSPAWAASVDLAPAQAATIFGLMNTLAQVAGAAAPILTPALAHRFGWIAALDFAALAAVLAGGLWIFVRPDRRVVAE